jgi:hypothetical protein
VAKKAPLEAGLFSPDGGSVLTLRLHPLDPFGREAKEGRVIAARRLRRLDGDPDLEVDFAGVGVSNCCQ